MAVAVGSEYEFRDATVADRACLEQEFWQAYLRDGAYARGASAMQLVGLLNNVRGTKDWKTTIIHAAGVPEEICGWMLWKGPRMLGWVHVKPMYRRNGLARALLTHAGVTRGDVSCAFMTTGASRIASGHGLFLWFTPYVALPSNAE